MYRNRVKVILRSHLNLHLKFGIGLTEFLWSQHAPNISALCFLPPFTSQFLTSPYGHVVHVDAQSQAQANPSPSATSAKPGQGQPKKQPQKHQTSSNKRPAPKDPKSEQREAIYNEKTNAGETKSSGKSDWKIMVQKKGFP